jgi:hypothetical protein
MRQTIESAPKDQEAIILEDDASGIFDVAHWSPEASEWINENGEPSKITPTHWQPLPHDRYLQPSHPSSHAGRARQRFAAFSITAAFIAAALTGLYFRAEVATWVTGNAGQQDIVGAIGGQTVAQATRLAGPEPRKIPQLKQAAKAPAPEVGQSLGKEPRPETLANEAAEARSAIDGSKLQLRAPAAVNSAQWLEQEREKTVALALEATAARHEHGASTEQQRHALQEERAHAAALAHELAVVRLEIEALAAQLTTTRDDAAKFRQIAERTSAEQQKERESAETLSRELATARGQIEANVTLLNKFRDDAAKFRQIADARAALGPTPNSLISQATKAVEPAAPVQPAAADAHGNPEAARLMARASTLLAQGNIGAARIVLERAAETSSAQANFMLAETYDPVILSMWGTHGTRGEATKARELYAKAHAGGIEEAKNRQDALTQ